MIPPSSSPKFSSYSCSNSVAPSGNSSNNPCTCHNNSLTPSPLTAEIGNTLIPSGSNSSFNKSITVSLSVSDIASILLAAITCGFSKISLLYFFNSSVIAWISTIGSLPSTEAPSTIWIITFVRSIWRKNSNPSPTPSDAPSMIPGISAITNPLLPSISTTPRFGFNVVKW